MQKKTRLPGRLLSVLLASSLILGNISTAGAAGFDSGTSPDPVSSPEVFIDEEPDIETFSAVTDSADFSDEITVEEESGGETVLQESPETEIPVSEAEVSETPAPETEVSETPTLETEVSETPAPELFFFFLRGRPVHVRRQRKLWRSSGLYPGTSDDGGGAGGTACPDIRTAGVCPS